MDRALLESVAVGDSPATVRLYGWARPTVSIGRFQYADDVDLEACRRRGIDVVRRATGGRGVLHDEELTYAFVARAADGIPRGTAASYAHLCGPLVVAYGVLGVDATVARGRSGRGSPAACFLLSTRADLTSGDVKVAGSAQVWSGDAVLQHGSLVIARDVDAEAEVFGLDREGRGLLKSGAATLRDLTGRPVGRDEVVDAVKRSVESVWGVELRDGAASAQEEALARAWAPDHVLWSPSAVADSGPAVDG